MYLIQYLRLLVASVRQTMNNVLPQQQESDNVLDTIFSLVHVK